MAYRCTPFSSEIVRSIDRRPKYLEQKTLSPTSVCPVVPPSFSSPAPIRLAHIEEAQRKTCRGVKRQEFLRFARRKWLASDLAAESVQRVFRGHIGRKRAALNAEVRRLTGDARAEWVEV